MSGRDFHLQASAFTLPALFRRSARIYAERTAVVSADGALTYRELDDRTNRLAQAMAGMGLARGDRVLVLSTTRPEYVELYVAASKLGVTVVTLNIRLAVSDLIACAELTRPSVLFASRDLVAPADAIAGSDAGIRRTVWFPSVGGDPKSDYERLLRGAPAAEPEVGLDPEDIHCVLFTSGTTGSPKGAMISHRASVMRAFRCADWFELTPEDGLIGWIPMFHTGGDECLQSTLLTGGTFATFEKVDIVAMYEAIQRHRLTWTPMLPGVITDFLRHPDRGRYDLSSFRFGLGYANLMPTVVEEFTRELGADFYDCFGQTESSFVVAIDRVRPGETPSLRKRPTPLLDLRIVDEDLREMPPGVPGECVVRGPTVMSGYIENMAATEHAFRGGWLHTGDVLVRHDDGTLSYVDRLTYMIKTGGENVYPAEIERVLVAHPSIREACVFGVPDEKWGEAIKAAIVATPGVKLERDEVAAWCRPRLAGFKRPRFAEFLDATDVPRSITGKILRRELERLPVCDEQRIAPSRSSSSP